MTKPKQAQKSLSGKTFSVIMPSFTCRGGGHNYGNYCTYMCITFSHLKLKKCWFKIPNCSSNFLKNPRMGCRGSWVALFRGRLELKFSIWTFWGVGRCQKCKHTNSLPWEQMEFGNKYNSARLKLHSYVDFEIRNKSFWRERSRSFIRCRNVFSNWRQMMVKQEQ